MQNHMAYLSAIKAASAGNNKVGIICVAVASIIFTTSDMLLKTLTGDYPLHQVVLFRALFAMLVTLGLFMPLEGGFRNLLSKRIPLHLLRGLCVVVANMSFFFGLASMPLADATAIFFFAPLLITALSVPFLGEVVGLRRWVAVLAGFVGVIVMVRPGSNAFQVAAIGPLIAAFAYASMQILTRKLGVTEKASTLAFYIQITFVFVCIAIGLVAGDGRFSEGIENPSFLFLLRAWVIPSIEDAGIMALIGIASSFGAYLISQGYRLTEAAVAAPFEYVALPFSIFWGVVVFGDWPDWITFSGIFVIASAGLYAFRREAAHGQTIAAKHPMPSDR